MAYDSHAPMKSLFASGYWRVTRFRGTPVRVHWTTPIGLFLFSRLSLNPLHWASVLLLFVVHELGHAYLARRHRLRVVSIDLTGIGGSCRVVGDPTVAEAATVAWGGVLAQAGVLVIALAARAVLHFATLHLVDGVFDTLITDNLLLIVLNLLPIAPLDGALAWRLFERS